MYYNNTIPGIGRYLLNPKYQSLTHKNVHIDILGSILFNGKEVKIAIEHQGPQHKSLDAYIRMNKPRDLKNNIIKSDADYEADWNNLVTRDKAKVKLFKELNKAGYYLIVVDHTIAKKDRAAFIWKSFLEQFFKQTKLTEF